MTACFKQCGFVNSIAVDKTRAHGALVSIVPLDLTKHEDQQAVIQWIKHPAIKGVFLAPPCGTASAAREIRIPGMNPPQPLRTLEEPDGISTLNGLDLVRVSAANMLYSFCAEVLELCCLLGKLFMLENPRNSLFWVTTVWSESNAAEQLYYQEHQACGYGSKRPKWTRLAANFPEVHTVDATCPGDHKHESWGIIQHGAKRVFATSLEVHYPQGLCKAIVHAFVLQLLQKGLTFQSNPSLQHSARAATMEQTPTLKLPPLVPSFKSKIVAFFEETTLVWPLTASITAAYKLLHVFKVGCKVDVKCFKVATEESKPVVFERLCAEFQSWGVDVDLVALAESFCFSFDEVRVFGVQWEPQEFLEQACAVGHPMSPASALPRELAETVEFCAKAGAVSDAKHRVEFFKFWNKRAKELQPKEQELRRSMDPVVEKAVKGKRLALFGEMLEYYKYPDAGVLGELTEGVSLVGEVPKTDMLPFKFTPALLTVDALRKQAEFRRAQSFGSCSGSGDSDIDLEVWRQTLEERDKGWLIGPLDPEEIPLDTPISKRFGLRQKHKVRLIDDYSESSINQTQTVLVTESPVLHTVDIACASVAHWFGCCEEINVDKDLVARTFDLASAYRQVGLNAEGRQFAYIRVFNPVENKWVVFQAQVLPFGAVRSVHSFLRLARAVWWIGTVGCKLMWSSFFDDYIVMSQPALAKSSELAAASLFKLLGWAFAEEGRKCVPFSLECEALGVVFNLSESHSGLCAVYNTGARVLELTAEINRVLEQGHITQLEAQKIRGRMQFAESQLYGRTGKRCIGALRDFACRRRSKIQTKETSFLKLFIDMLNSGTPRKVFCENKHSVVIITDACYEKASRDRVCGLGGVMVDRASGLKLFFSCKLDEEQRRLLGEPNRKQIIFEAESLCAVLAYKLWSDFIVGKKNFLYVDNEGTKFSLIRGRSDNSVVDAIAHVFAEIEAATSTLCWISRVSSYSNLADDPSRGDPTLLLQLGFEDVSTKACESLRALMLSVEKQLGKMADNNSPSVKRAV